MLNSMTKRDTLTSSKRLCSTLTNFWTRILLREEEARCSSPFKKTQISQILSQLRIFCRKSLWQWIRFHLTTRLLQLETCTRTLLLHLREEINQGSTTLKTMSSLKTWTMQVQSFLVRQDPMASTVLSRHDSKTASRMPQGARTTFTKSKWTNRSKLRRYLTPRGWSKESFRPSEPTTMKPSTGTTTKEFHSVRWWRR